MAQLDTSKSKDDSTPYLNMQRGNYEWKDETQKEVIFVPDEKGKFLRVI